MIVVREHILHYQCRHYHSVDDDRLPCVIIVSRSGIDDVRGGYRQHPHGCMLYRKQQDSKEQTKILPLIQTEQYFQTVVFVLLKTFQQYVFVDVLICSEFLFKYMRFIVLHNISSVFIISYIITLLSGS